MKKNLLSFIVLFSMLIGMVSSAAATPTVKSIPEFAIAQLDEPIQDESVIARVYFTSRDDLNSLSTHYDILEVNHEQGFALFLLSPDEYITLQLTGYRLEIDASKTKTINQPHLLLPGQGTDTIPGYPCYRTVEETYSAMQAINVAHPDLAQIFDIGDSWTRIHSGFPNGYDIFALRLSNENFGVIADKPTFFLMAEIHAREYVTAEAAMRYAEYLISNYNIDPDITWLLDYFRVYIVTMTNPDGRKLAEAGNLWRKNVDNDDGCSDPGSWGVDLNRNSSFKWGCCDGSDSYPCGETYRGPGRASEPEIAAIQSFAASILGDWNGSNGDDEIPPASAANTPGVFITLHSAAGLVLWPWGWTSTDAPNATQLQTLGRRLAFYNSYTPQQSNDLYTTDGTTDDWSYGKLGIASFTFEMGTDFFQDCSSFNSYIYPDNRDALFYAFKTARQPYMNPDGPDSLNITAIPAAAEPGEPVQLTAIADGTRFGGSGEPIHTITEARYSIDNPSWITDTVTYPMTAVDGTLNENVEDIVGTIDTSGLSAGRHTIFVESKNANNWGVVSSTFLYIVDPGVSPVIEGYVREAGTNLPLAATVTAGLFSTSTDPATGFYSMTVISGTYDMVAEADNFAPAYSNGVVALDYETISQDFILYPVCNFFTDNVENGNQGWTAQAPWAITTEASNSPTHSWTDSPGVSYGNYRNISLTSQTFDLSASTGVTLDFWHTYQTEAGWDYGLVEYSTDGSSWTTVATYDGFQTTWTEEQIPIPGLDGQANARIRYRFTSDSNTVYDGWHIDDISIIAGGPGCMPPAPPVVEFTSNSPVLIGDPVQFDNLTTGSEPITYDWNFGDGSASSEFEPTHLYADIGNYTVILTATNGLGTDSISHTVTVEPIDFTSVDLTRTTPGIIYAGEPVDFSADLLPDDANKPYNYTIDYGDGFIDDNASDLDPLPLVHIYSSGGIYTIMIEVMNVGMTVPVTDSLDLEVIEPVTITSVDLTLDSPMPIYAGDPVQFSADLAPEDAIKPYTYTILYGDGISSTNTSSDDPLAFEHVYTNGGNFAVQIAVWNDVMTDPVTDSLSLVVLVPLEPLAEFSSNSPVLLGQPVQFTNQTIGIGPITYEWDFGDAAGTSTESNPSYTYAAIGTFTVTLEATNALGSDSVSHQVTVEPIAITMVALTQLSAGPIFIGDTVEFSADLSPDTATKPYTYTIDYGDGTLLTSTSSDDPLSLSHSYATGGNDTISIEVWNEAMVDSVTDTLDVTVIYRSFLPLTTK